MGVIERMAHSSRQELQGSLLLAKFYYPSSSCSSSSSYDLHTTASVAQLTELVNKVLARKLNNPLQDQTKATAQTIIDQSDRNVLPPKGTLYNFARRYSRPQVSSTDDTFDANALIQKFNNSLNFSGNCQGSASNEADSDSEPDPHVLQRYFGRRRSSPDVATLSQLRSSNLQVASRISSQTVVESSGESQLSKGMDKCASYSNLQAATDKESAAKPSLCPSAMPDSVDAASADPSSNSGFGILSRTRKFGAWLTKATEGEKVEVTKKDLNAFAPTSF